MPPKKGQQSRSKGRAAGVRSQQRRRPPAQRGMRMGQSAPVQFSTQYRSPQLKKETTLEHKEMIQDLPINADGTFSLTRYAVNPGNGALHPWLAQQAQGWEEFEYEKLAITVRSTCPTATSGLTLLGAQYDFYDAAFGSKVEMQDYGGNISQNVWVPLTRFEFDCKVMRNRQKTLYILPDGDSPSGDSRQYYPAWACFATSNGDSNAPATVGECFVEYRVRLIKQKVNPNFSASNAEKQTFAPTASFTVTSDGPLSGAAGSTVFDSGSPWDYSSGPTADTFSLNDGHSAQMKGSMPYWLVSALGGGQYSSTGPTATAGLTYTVGAGVNQFDVTHDDALQKDGTHFSWLKQVVLDARNIVDNASEKLIDFKYPTIGSTGNIVGSTGFSHVLASAISRKAFQSIVSLTERKFDLTDSSAYEGALALAKHQLALRGKCSFSSAVLRPRNLRVMTFGRRPKSVCGRLEVARPAVNHEQKKVASCADLVTPREKTAIPGGRPVVCMLPLCKHDNSDCPLVRELPSLRRA